MHHLSFREEVLCLLEIPVGQKVGNGRWDVTTSFLPSKMEIRSEHPATMVKGFYRDQNSSIPAPLSAPSQNQILVVRDHSDILILEPMGLQQD